MPYMITCNICHQAKNTEEFYFRSNGKPRKECKSCRSLKNSKYYKANEEAIKQQTAEYKELNIVKIKQDSIDYYLSNKKKIREEQKVYQNSPRGKLIHLLSDALSRSKTKKKQFDLDIEFLLEMFEKQNGRCALTDINFSFEKPKNYRVDPWTISLDRINSKLGYTKDNVRLVCTIVNFALNEWGEDNLIAMSKAVTERSNNEEKNK
jgi:hypothetical protein